MKLIGSLIKNKDAKSNLKIKSNLQKIINILFALFFNPKLLLILSLLGLLIKYFDTQRMGLLSIYDFGGLIAFLLIFSSFGWGINIFRKFRKKKRYIAILVSLITLIIFALLVIQVEDLKRTSGTIEVIEATLTIIFLTAGFSFLFFFFPALIKSTLWLKNKFLLVIKSKQFKTLLLTIKKLVLFLVLLLFLFILIFNKNIPAFIYNELEWQARLRYLMAERTKEAMNFMIGARGGLPEYLVSDQKRAKIPQELEKAVEVREGLINEYLYFNNLQAKIPFLPKKYKEYHQMKTKAFENYQKGFETFKKAHQDEEKVLKLWNQLSSIKKFLINCLLFSRFDPHYLQKMENVTFAKNIIKESKQLYKKNIINKNLNDYFVFESQRLLDLYYLFRKFENKPFDQKATQEFFAILSRQSGLPEAEDIILNWHQNIFDPQSKKMDQYHQLALEQITKSDRYYKDNNLKNDLISRLLSKFFKSYPRNI